MYFTLANWYKLCLNNNIDITDYLHDMSIELGKAHGIYNGTEVVNHFCKCDRAIMSHVSLLLLSNKPLFAFPVMTCKMFSLLNFFLQRLHFV